MKIGDIVGSSFVYAAESTILRVAVKTASADDAFLTSRRRIRGWLQSICARYNLQTAIEADTTLANERCAIDATVRASRFTVALRHGDDRFPERTWYVDLDLRSEEGGDVAVCDLRLRVEHPSNARPVDPHPTRLLSLLCSEPGLHDVEPLTSEPHAIQPFDVPRLVALIDAPTRRLPVILASRPVTLDLRAIAGELAGVAHVFELDIEASWEISRRYDKRFSTYSGAVRIYSRHLGF